LTLLAAWPVAGDVGSVLRNVVTPSKKLFLATALVAAGYGVAALMGAPDPRQWPKSLAKGLPAPNRAALTADASANSSRVGSVRLLPESSAAAAERYSIAGTVSVPAPKATASSQMTAASSTFQPTASSTATRSPLLAARPLPRATLKNEPPRPLLEAERPAAPAPQRQVDAMAYSQQVSPTDRNAEPHVLSAGFAPTPMPATGSIRATSESSPRAFPELRLAPPSDASPLSIAHTDDAPVRTHIIVDGDSLAKLAGRYLDDPRRSNEIFTLNRGVLSDPELLPIGAELKIPPRGAGVARTSWPQSQLMGSTTVHSAEHTGFATPRVLPPTSPRAQLLPPRPAE
jgi:nucleoid-associated protein YgaU